MTVEDLKRLDKQLQCIPYPCGKNFPLLKKILKDSAKREEVPVSVVIQQYMAWKWRK